MPHRHHRRGLTLIEILVVVAILGLFMVAMLLFVFPSDERRCELEAKKLAAYLTMAGAESAMRDGSVRVVFDLHTSTGIREVTKVGAAVIHDVWQEDKRAAKHTVDHPVVIDTVDTPDVPNLTSGRGYVLFRNGKCPRGAVVVLRVQEVLYSVVVPPTGGEVRVEKGRSPIPGGIEGQRPKRAPRRGKSGTTSSPPDYSAGSLGAPMPVTSKPYTPSSSSSRSSSKGSSNKGSTPSKSADSDSVGSSPKSSSSNFGSLGDLPDPLPDLPDPEPIPETEPKEPESGICTPGDIRCPTSSITETCIGSGASANWGSRRECQFPLECRSGIGCTSPNSAVGEPSVMRLTSVVVDEPSAVKGLLQGLFNPVLQSESMIWLWHRQQSTTGQTLDYWLVQASRDILADGAEYVARDEVPSYRLEARDDCEIEEGRCFDVVAEPPETKSVIKLYVPRSDADENECDYFVIEVVNVVIEVDYQSAKLRFSGVVSRRSARSIVVEGVSLFDKLTEMGVAQDGDVNGDGLKDSWLLDFEGSTDAVPFTDNPAPHEFDTPPYCL